MNKNVVLIGMPGSGKSTLGVILAKMVGFDFVDTDVLIQLHEHRTLQDIVDTEGYMVLRQIEGQVIQNFHATETIVATGGSAVYDHEAMMHLKAHGVAVYLDVPLHELERRVGDYSKRGLAKRPDQTFDDLFAERTQLYQTYADYTFPHAGETPEALAEKIITRLQLHL